MNLATFSISSLQLLTHSLLHNLNMRASVFVLAIFAALASASVLPSPRDIRDFPGKPDNATSSLNEN